MPTVLRLSDEAETALNLARPAELGQGSRRPAAWPSSATRDQRRGRGGAAGGHRVLMRLRRGARPEAGETWERDRYRGPYLRDALLDAGALVETLETVTSGPRSPACTAPCRARCATRSPPRARRPSSLPHLARLRAGASLYFTVGCAALEDPLAQWRAAKAAASDAILAAGGSITHHHGVGIDHRDWYGGRSESSRRGALRAVKARARSRRDPQPGHPDPGEPGARLEPHRLHPAAGRADRPLRRQRPAGPDRRDLAPSPARRRWPARWPRRPTGPAPSSSTCGCSTCTSSAPARCTPTRTRWASCRPGTASGCAPGRARPRAISLTGPGRARDLMEGVDPELLGADMLPADQGVDRGRQRAHDQLDGRAVPHPGLGRAGPSRARRGRALARLWEEVAHVCRLDEADPVAAWEARLDRLIAVAAQARRLAPGRAPLRGTGDRSDRRAAARQPLDGGRADDGRRDRPRPEPPHRGGVHDARSGANRRRGRGDQAAVRLRRR